MHAQFGAIRVEKNGLYPISDMEKFTPGDGYVLYLFFGADWSQCHFTGEPMKGDPNAHEGLLCYMPGDMVRQVALPRSVYRYFLRRHHGFLTASSFS